MVCVEGAPETYFGESPEQRTRRHSVFRTHAAMRCRQIFPGVPPQIRPLRQWLTGLLPDCPARADVVTIAVEYATNAIQHTASGRQGGYFVVELTWYGPAVRVAVADGGGPSEPRVLDRSHGGDDGCVEHGRGLRVVEKLSARTGVIGDSHGRVMWAEVVWLDRQVPPATVPEQIHENVIAAQEQTLRARFDQFLTWYGRETQQWWACPKRSGASAASLVAAASATDLAAQLSHLTSARFAHPAEARRT